MSDEKQKSLRDMWGTPDDVFQFASEKWGPFKLDVAATDKNAKCPYWFSLERGQNALEVPWSIFKWPVEEKPLCWMNPPYSDPYPWMKKAREEAKKGCRVVALVNADHTTAWYKEFICDTTKDPQVPHPGVTIFDWPKRIKFKAPPGLVSKKTGKPVLETTNPFPSILVVFDPPPGVAK